MRAQSEVEDGGRECWDAAIQSRFKQDGDGWPGFSRKPQPSDINN